MITSCRAWPGHVVAPVLPTTTKVSRCAAVHLGRCTRSGSGEAESSSVAGLVRMLGPANPLHKREEAADELWRLAESGQGKVDEMVSYPGCLDLVVSLVASDCEAAAGLLGQVSAMPPYRAMVVEAGAVEHITGLLARKDTPPEVRGEAANVLVNLATEPALRDKVATLELLSAVFGMLESEQPGDQAAAAGIIARLSLSQSIRDLLLQAGAVPKLAMVLKANFQKVSKVTRSESRNALLRLAQNGSGKVAITKEGLTFVPLIGADAYKSLNVSDERASEVTEKVTPNDPLGSQESPFGAGDVLLGLNTASPYNVDDATQLAMQGRSRLSFLKRLGLIEPAASKNMPENEAQKWTILPWWDAIPRLVLILGLENVSFAMRGAQAVEEAATTEDYRRRLAKAGAIPHLVYLLGSGDERAMQAAAGALETLSVSKSVGRSLNAFGAVPTLVSVLKAPGVPESLLEKVVGALVNLSQTLEEVEAMVWSGNVAGVLDIVNSEDATVEAKAEAEHVLKEIMSLKADPRDKIVDAGGVPALIQLASSSTFVGKHKAAAVLENVATKEAHAVSMANAGADSALRCLLQPDGGGSAWLSVYAGCRLLGTLVDWERNRKALDCSSYAVLLADIVMREGCPAWVKDWISGCLVKLACCTAVESQQRNSQQDQVVDTTIPRLAMEIKAGNWAAVEELRQVMWSGIPKYAWAVGRAGGIEAVMDMLVTAPDAAAREAALSIVYNASMAGEAVLLRGTAAPLLGRMVKEEEGSGWKLALELLKKRRPPT